MAPEPLERGVAAAAGMYRQLVERGRLADTDAAAKQRLITATTDYGAGFADVDLAVEAVSEDLPLKIRVLAELEEQVRPDTLIASNTSSLPIEELASALQRPRSSCSTSGKKRNALLRVHSIRISSPALLTTTCTKPGSSLDMVIVKPLACKSCRSALNDEWTASSAS